MGPNYKVGSKVIKRQTKNSWTNITLYYSLKTKIFTTPQLFLEGWQKVPKVFFQIYSSKKGSKTAILSETCLDILMNQSPQNLCMYFVVFPSPSIWNSEYRQSQRAEAGKWATFFQDKSCSMPYQMFIYRIFNWKNMKSSNRGKIV